VLALLVGVIRKTFCKWAWCAINKLSRAFHNVLRSFFISFPSRLHFQAVSHFCCCALLLLPRLFGRIGLGTIRAGLVKCLLMGQITRYLSLEIPPDAFGQTKKEGNSPAIQNGIPTSLKGQVFDMR
jgi:hypothetical protein